MLHLIPDDDGLPHAPTTECGCDPQPGRWRNRPAMFHGQVDLFDDGPTFRDATIPFVRLREVMNRDRS